MRDHKSHPVVCYTPVLCASPAVLVRDVLLQGPPFPKVVIPLRLLFFASVFPDATAAAAVVVCHPECHVYYSVNAVPHGGTLSGRSAGSVLFRGIGVAAAGASAVGIDYRDGESSDCKACLGPTEKGLMYGQPCPLSDTLENRQKVSL